MASIFNTRYAGGVRWISHLAQFLTKERKMATIVHGNKEWSAVIRCAHPVCGGGLYRVDGCFALIEITLDDIKSSVDYEGDRSYWVVCPSCGQTLYPEWQIGNGPLENSLKHNENKGDNNACNQKRF